LHLKPDSYNLEAMIVMNVKLPPQLRNALKRLAEEKTLTMSDVIRLSLIEYLEKHGINWQEEDD